MMIRKQVLLDNEMVELFDELKAQCPLASDTVIIRAALLAARELGAEALGALCIKAYMPAGRPKESHTH